MKSTLIVIAIVAGVSLALVGSSYLFGEKKDNPVQHEFVDAAAAGDIEDLRIALQGGATVDGFTSSEGGSYFGGPALVDAIESQEVEAVKWLLNHGANPHRVYATETPLEIAEFVYADSHTDAAAKIVDLVRGRGSNSP
jgi:hypothetical protein